MESISTPSRPISSEQFQSLRQRMVKESPYLYRNKVLSDPGKKFNSLLKDDSAYEREYVPLEDERLNTKLSPNEIALKKNEEMTEDLGNFENPVLGKLAERTVNKEYETHTIVVNLVALAIWDLLIKFYKLFIDYTRYGERLVCYLQDELIRNHLMGWRRYLQMNFPFLLKWINWSNVDTIFHLIVVYNVILSLWRLFSKVRVDDLNLTEAQKELLGLDTLVNPEISRRDFIIQRPSTVTKPHVILDSRANEKNGGPAEAVSSSNGSTIANTPYLFKSLETPLKKKQKEQQQAQLQAQKNQQHQQLNLHRHAQSAFVSKVNAFGSLRNNIVGPNNFGGVQTPEGRTGYIPSNKYAYMVNSPCPRRKM